MFILRLVILFQALMSVLLNGVSWPAVPYPHWIFAYLNYRIWS